MSLLPLLIGSETVRHAIAADELLCPTCDQPVTPQKFEEIQARERERAAIVEHELEDRFARAMAEGEAARKAEIESIRKEAAAAVEQANHDAAVREASIREEAAKSIRAEITPKLAELEESKRLAEQRVKEVTENQDKRLQEQREALESAHKEALNAEKANAFSHNQKLEEKVEQLQRQLQEKTAHELGEGAEINLFEELKRAFPHNQIARVGKGVSGADIIHRIMMNRRACGTIIYDSKNRARWADEYAAKLRRDQLAENAEHAIPCTAAFPKKARQIYVQDGVILLNPARVIAMVSILRGLMVQAQVLRLSNEERSEKTARVYALITSERATKFFQQHEAFTDKMLEIEVKETRAHQITWKNRGELIKGQQKLFLDFWMEIEHILGTGDVDGSNLDE